MNTPHKESPETKTESSTDKAKSAKRSRAVRRAYATKILKETDVLLLNDHIDSIKHDLRANEIILNDKLSELKSLDMIIQENITDDIEYAHDFAAAKDFQKDLLRTIIAIAYRLDGTPQTLSLSAGFSSVMTQTNRGNYSETRELLINDGTTPNRGIPKLMLPKFDGSPLEFQSFWDNFESTVHKNDMLDDIEKFNYLKCLLEGKASVVLQGLSSENYRSAIELLHRRFGNAQIIITAHMDALIANHVKKFSNHVKDSDLQLK